MSSPIALSLALSAALSGCAERERAAPRYPTREARDAAARALSDAASSLAAARPRTLHVSATFRGRGHEQSGRGVVAVRPPSDVRLQLLGPSGLTALDVWVSGSRDRLAVPALGRVEVDGPARPGRPQAFLRWWLLSPLSGRLLWVDESGVATLRAADGAVVTVSLGGGRVRATRRTPADVERVDAALTACGDARWSSERGEV